MSKPQGFFAIIFGILWGITSWTCDQVLPVVAIEPQAQADEMCRIYPVAVYDDPVDGGLGECMFVDVWSDK